MSPSISARIRDGDREAFSQMFDELSSPVYRHALRVLDDPHTAQDVVSLTFLEAWRLRKRLDEDLGEIRPWIFGIATNVLRNTSRAARRHRNALARMHLPEPVPDISEGVVTRIDDTERIAAVRRAFAGLRRKEREVIALCVWSELDYGSAALALGIPVGTVRSRLWRARKHLRCAVEHQAGSTGKKREPVRSPRTSTDRLHTCDPVDQEGVP